MPNIDKRPYRADGGDISTGRLKEIADNPYGDEEKCWLAKRVLALLDELEVKDRRIAELEAREAKTMWSDIDMSDADCFTITRLHEIIYASELKWPEPKLLARFMHDVKQRHPGTARGE